VGTVTKKTAGFPGFDHFRFRQQDASFSYWRVNILYSMEPATIAVVLVTSVLLYDAVLYGCTVQQHCSTAVRRTEVQYIGRQCVRTVNYAKYVTARNLIGPCRAPQLSTNFYRFKPISDAFPIFHACLGKVGLRDSSSNYLGFLRQTNQIIRLEPKQSTQVARTRRG